jgi:hypothetical protein
MHLTANIYNANVYNNNNNNFGPKRDEVTGEWRRLHNKELYALYSSPNINFLSSSGRFSFSGRTLLHGVSNNNNNNNNNNDYNKHLLRQVKRHVL